MEKKCSKCEELQQLVNKLTATINLFLHEDPDRKAAAEVIVTWMKTDA